MWYAKPSGQYYLNTTEANGNILEMNVLFNNAGYTLESQAGLLGCVFGESGLNPWRWQMINGHDTVNYSNGYGLFQFTPARDYFDNCSNLPNFSPNTSVTEIVSGATPQDGHCQTYVVINDILHKWTTDCWRSYWSTSEYSTLYAQSRHIVNTYGSNGKLSQSEFSQIDNIEDATLAFLACYEGPGVPDYSVRLNYANTIYPMLSGDVPPTPPIPPTPPTPIPKRKMPVWMMALKRIH